MLTFSKPSSSMRWCAVYIWLRAGKKILKKYYVTKGRENRAAEVDSHATFVIKGNYTEAEVEEIS